VSLTKASYSLINGAPINVLDYGADSTGATSSSAAIQLALNTGAPDMLEKVTSVDLIEVVENGCIQVRTKTAIKEDGVEISNKFHRHVVVPGADYSNEDAKVQAIASSIHTPEVVEAYRLAQLDRMPNNTVPARLTGESQDSQ